MFSIKAQFELSGIEATSPDGSNWDATFTMDGEKSESVKLASQDLLDIIAINMHPDAEPEGFQAMYDRLTPKLAHLGSLSPIT